MSNLDAGHLQIAGGRRLAFFVGAIARNIWAAVWRTRRDLNPCYRRERIAIARNPWRASGMDGSLQWARKRPRQMLDGVLDPGERRMDRNWTDAGDRFAGR